MKIEALRLFNVKRFAGRGVAIEGIDDGVNVLCAPNEFGKSTSFEALHALFFQAHTGTPQAVQALRPYAGGSPQVEVDISNGDGRYRLSKQFYAGRSARVTDIGSGRLIAQADEAEAFIAELVRGGHSGPAGLLWVRQGLTGIEKRSKSEEDSEKQIRASLLESVQGEIEAVTGGRRMTEIMANIEETLGGLVTATGRPKTGERYAAALETRSRLEAEEQRLGAEVVSLRQALDQRAAANRRLSELDNAKEREERRRAIETAQAKFEAARSQAESLRTAKAELRLVSEQRETADNALTSFRTALDRAATLTRSRDEASRAHEEAMARRNSAAAAVATARAESDAAETAQQEARTLLERLDRAMRARETAERLTELQDKLATAEDLRRQTEEADAALKLLALPEDAIPRLEKIDLEIVQLRALAQAARPSVEVAYEPQAPGVALDGHPLEDGVPRTYRGMAKLHILGVGTIALNSGATDAGDDRLERLVEHRRSLLDKLGVEDLTAARRRQQDHSRKQGELRELNARFSMIAPEGLQALRQDIAARQQAVSADDPEPEQDPAQLRAAFDDAEQRRQNARSALREAEPAQTLAADAVISAQASLAGIRAELAQAEAIIGPEALRAEHERQLHEKRAQLDAALLAHRQTVERLEGEATDLQAAEATLARLRSVADSASAETARLREQIAALSAEIRSRSDEAVEEKWRETTEALEAAAQRVAAYEREIAILQRLRGALEAARTNARETYLRPVITELRPLLGLLFDDVAITFDDKTLLPQTILRDGQEEDVDRLSGGMREQLSILTRLAFARLLARDGHPAPVILDDALVYSDDDRIERMFDALHRQARDQQIIVFSCRQRAFQQLGGNVLHMTDWAPQS
ncbi:DNA-binding protein [Pseudohoeflea suaedae]|uniref:DNA-binding protein n=1 Tax=Pseudohoeflea suaedae TaxID=877384 RepID=A0A4R5PKM6_9HYPH|nr:AAA family ATPase [Pseudohoeflea suaedae]TDH36281.1 DNA-binding protein [Pseudohoeflea suaedae]